jgi:hypothetical protein
MTYFATHKYITGRKWHRCAFCQCSIQPETVHLKMAGNWGGDFYSNRGHVDCELLWNALFAEYGDASEGMRFNLCTVLTSWEPCEVQESLDAQRGFTPHAVNRLEWMLRDWLALQAEGRG